jgi:hypothetical protein
MATKKQKREAGLARREKFEAETKASGLEALRLCGSIVSRGNVGTRP